MSDQARIGDFGYSGSAGSSPELDALHARVAELKKELDAALERAFVAEAFLRDAREMTNLAEAGLAAAQEAVEEYLLWRPCERGHAAAHHKLADHFRRDAPARGGGQQDTG